MRQLQSQSENAGVGGGGWGANELTANLRGYMPHMVCGIYKRINLLCK